ncbi:hypothetical protein ElyMa_002783200 [Elysia marginata]|uniref:HTH psq-type domain-containing protein n=1 Tax=Elysia marginata TaxID=1093978 RepID=A0AAV4HMC3_9GAST|nr:hypothetical protein ElyMa_002783200 [Elysia marginata]
MGPKHLFSGKRRVEIATTIAVGNFNSGSTALRMLSKECGCRVGAITISYVLERDFRRIKQAEKAETVEAKRRMVEVARAITLAQQEFLVAEGGPSSVSGGF